MARPPENIEVFVDDVKIGAVRAGEVLSYRPSREIALDLSFRPNWVGLWNLQVTLAGEADK